MRNQLANLMFVLFSAAAIVLSVCGCTERISSDKAFDGEIVSEIVRDLDLPER